MITLHTNHGDIVIELDFDKAPVSAANFLAYARDGDRVKSRFFAPAGGVPEDPATGSAAVALAHSLKLRGESEGAVAVHQGDEIGHPSTIHLTWSDGPTTIGGTVRHDEVVQVP